MRKKVNPMAVEAIIISGPRKDEFISLPEEIIEEPPAEVVEALNAALKELER